MRRKTYEAFIICQESRIQNVNLVALPPAIIPEYLFLCSFNNKDRCLLKCNKWPLCSYNFMMMGPIIYSSCAASDNFSDNNVWPCILCKYQILCSTRSERSFPGNKIMCMYKHHKGQSLLFVNAKILFSNYSEFRFIWNSLHCGHIMEISYT